MPWYSDACHGWPRNYSKPSDWINKTSNYVWNIAAARLRGDSHACPPCQRTPFYQNDAQMVTAAPGDVIRLRFVGNGHTRGYNVGGQPGPNSGTVTVYWKGQPEDEIIDISEFNASNTLQSQGFSDISFSYPANPNITGPEQGLVDKGNWMELKLPRGMAPGRHMMVWVWWFTNAPQWSTCFDINVLQSISSPASVAVHSSIIPIDTNSRNSTGKFGQDYTLAPFETLSELPPAPAVSISSASESASATTTPTADNDVVVTVTEIVDVYTTITFDESGLRRGHLKMDVPLEIHEQPCQLNLTILTTGNTRD
jgi:hypothetical protein